MSATPAVALAVGGLCTARELARYENPLRFDAKRVLYALFWTLPAPFTILPYKPIVALLASETYPYAFAHFITGHTGVANLSFHVVALAMSLVSQFAFMAQVGAGMEDVLGNKALNITQSLEH